MSIIELSSLISSAAVLTTLLLLLLQMRQTNRNQKALMQQGRTARINASQGQTMEPAMAAAMARAFASDTGLDPLQIRMLNAFTQSFFWSHEDSFLQHRSGLLDEASWASDLVSIRTALTSPAFRVGWKMSRVQTAGAFRDFIDTQLKNVTPQKAFDEASIWKHLMAKELAEAV